ncbi:MAG: ABC transporter transmembrane domain-containing protein [Candidatus Nanopelagicales bacterium]
MVGVLLWQAVPLFRVMQVKIDKINAVLRENLTGIRVIRAFVRTEHEQDRFADANADLTDTALRVTRLFAITMPALMLIMNLSSVAIIWFGGHFVDDGSMQIGDLTAFLSYIMQILFSVMMAVMLMVMVPRAAASAERIAAVLDTEPKVIDPVAARSAAATPRRRGVPGRGVPLPGCRGSSARPTSISPCDPGRSPRSSARPVPARRR